MFKNKNHFSESARPPQTVSAEFTVQTDVNLVQNFGRDKL